MKGVSVINKLVVTKSCITVKTTDASTIQGLEQFGPVHHNRKMTEHKVSSRWLPEVLTQLRGIHDASQVYKLPESVQHLWYAELQARLRVSDVLLHGAATPNAMVNGHLTLMPHQQMGREIAQVRDRFCFFFDTRTGKTPLSLSIIYDDLQRHSDHKWLVICPLILIENAWLEDAAQFVPELKVISCHAPTKAKRLKLINSDAQVYITNTESFATYKEHFDKLNFEGCIVDESSSMKSYKSKQSKAIVEFAQSVNRFYLLSGTPAPNGEWEYYRQLQAIDYYCVPPSWTQFKQRYFVDVSFSQYEQLQLRPDKKDEFDALLKRYAVYVDKEDVLTTPGRKFIDVMLDLPDQLKAHYRQLKNELYIELGKDHQLTVPSAAAKLNKLNQLTSGFVIDTQAVKENRFYNESQQETYFLSNYRFKALYDLLESPQCHGEQVLIWANYKKEFEELKRGLGDQCRCVYGDTSIQEKTEAIKLFKSGRIKYLVANPASADKGLTLTNCHICVYFSLNWSYELFKQSMERIYGDIRKQKRECYYYIMMAKHTIDEVLYRDVLQSKGDASTAVLNNLKANNAVLKHLMTGDF